MRSVLILSLGFTLAALVWAFFMPLSAHALVRSLADPDNDRSEIEAALLACGRNADGALLEGLESSHSQVRLRCARVLALKGDRRGDAALLKLLSAPGNDETAVAQAEAYLTAAWSEREGPPAVLRGKLLREETFKTDADRLLALNEALGRFPGWTAGYVQRAIVYQRTGSVLEARLDALHALELEPSHYEAMIVLGNCNLLLSAPDQAYSCYDQAVRLNPRLRLQFKSEIRDLLRTIEIERARRRREKRREMPLA
ncbi:MAG TPA: hypothetical protein VEJ63_10755 [Planctomycetota bacterium]|nr:hypothetical protein [Planctomycetota bacterium]